MKTTMLNSGALLLLVPFFRLTAGQITLTLTPSVAADEPAPSGTIMSSVVAAGGDGATTITTLINGTTYVVATGGPVATEAFAGVDGNLTVSAIATVYTSVPSLSTIGVATTTAGIGSTSVASTSGSGSGTHTTGSSSGTRTSTSSGLSTFTGGAPTAHGVNFGIGLLGVAGVVAMGL